MRTFLFAYDKGEWCNLLFFTPCVSQPPNLKEGRLVAPNRTRLKGSFGHLRGVSK